MKIETTTAKQVESLSKDQVFHMLQCAEACLAKQASERAALVEIASIAETLTWPTKWQELMELRVARLEVALANLYKARTQ